jgi:cell division septum initiation protein DivIVA
MAGGVMALGAKAFTEGIGAAKEAFTGTYDTAIDLYKTIGLSANEAAGLASSIQGASMFSLTVSAEDAAAAATAMSDAFGTTQHINSETLKDVAELSNLLGDGAGAVAMQQIFEQAGADASDMTSEIKDIASGVGVNASAVLKDMASQQNQMLGNVKRRN